MESLPDAVLLNVLPHLKANSTRGAVDVLLSAGHTSRRLRRISFSSQLWKGGDLAHLTDPQALLHILDRLKGDLPTDFCLSLEKVAKVKTMTPVLKTSWSSVAQRLGPSLSSLEITGWPRGRAKTSEFLITSFLDQAPSLTDLKLAWEGDHTLSRIEARVAKLPLKRFTITYPETEGKAGDSCMSFCHCEVSSLLSKMQMPDSLESLNMVYKRYACKDDTPNPTAIALTRFPNLEELKVNLGRTIIPRVTNVPKLQRLSLISVSMVLDINKVPTLRSVREYLLQYISMPGTVAFEDHGLERYEGAGRGGCQGMLKTLCFKRCPNLHEVLSDDEAPDLTFEDCPRLGHMESNAGALSIVRCPAIHTLAIATSDLAFLRDLPALTFLQHFHLPSFAPVNNLPTLEALKCCWPTDSTSAVLELSALTTLIIFFEGAARGPYSLKLDCPKLRDLMLVPACQNNVSTLKDLDLKACADLRKISLIPLEDTVGGMAASDWAKDLIQSNVHMRSKENVRNVYKAVSDVQKKLLLTHLKKMKEENA